MGEVRCRSMSRCLVHAIGIVVPFGGLSDRSVSSRSLTRRKMKADPVPEPGSCQEGASQQFFQESEDACRARRRNAEANSTARRSGRATDGGPAADRTPLRANSIEDCSARLAIVRHCRGARSFPGRIPRDRPGLVRIRGHCPGWHRDRRSGCSRRVVWPSGEVLPLEGLPSVVLPSVGPLQASWRSAVLRSAMRRMAAEPCRWDTCCRDLHPASPHCGQFWRRLNAE